MYIKLIITTVLVLSICYASTNIHSVPSHDIQPYKNTNNFNKRKEKLRSNLNKMKTKNVCSFLDIFKEQKKCFDDFSLKVDSSEKQFDQTRKLHDIDFEFNNKLFVQTQNQLSSKNKTFEQYTGSMGRAKLSRDVLSANENIIDLDPFDADSNANSHLIITENRHIRKRETDDYQELNDTSYNESEVNSNETESEEEYLQQIKEFIFPKTWTWVLIFFHTAVFVIGLVGNTLVCVAVYRNHTMRTVTNYFIVNLAVADFLVILLCLPPSVIWDVTMTWFLGVIMCKIVLYLQTVSVTVSVLTLTFISVDRWYAICFPLKFKSTTGRAKTAIGIIWLLALIFDIPELVVYRTVPSKLQIDTIYFTQCEPSWSVDTDRNWIILKMILLYAIPLIFMTVAYCQIIRVLWKSGNVHHHSLDISGGRQVNTFTMNTNTSTEGQLRSRRKAAKMLVAVVIMFAVCYFPVHLLSVLRATVSMSNSEINRAFSLISHWLCYANSAVNPIIYNFMSGKFRKEFGVAFTSCSNHESSRTHRSNTLSATYVYRFTSSHSCRMRTETIPLDNVCNNENKINT